MMMLDYFLNLKLPTDPTRIVSVQTRVDDMMVEHKYGKRDRFAVRLSLEEALINAMKHGNSFDAQKTVRLQCVVTPVRLVVEVEDEGLGFNPSEVPDPTTPKGVGRFHGRGLYLMRNYMTRVLHSNGGRLVVMEKVRSSKKA